MWIHKLQELPEKKRKFILWAVLGVIALVLLAWWINSIRETLIHYGE